MVLLTLTHELRWWIPRTHEEIIGANQHFLIVDCWRTEDVVTGQRTLLLGGEWSAFGCQVNGKWLVCRDKPQKNMAVLELPTRCTFGERFSPSAKKPTVVPLPFDGDCQIYLDTSCEDRMLFSFTVSGLNNFQVRSLKLMLIDLAQTNSLKELVVLSVTEPQLELFSVFEFPDYSVLTKQCGAHVFVGCVATSCNHPAFIAIEEGTAHMNPAQDMPRIFPRSISPLSHTQFCLFGSHKDTYDVWDVTDTTRPARTMKCLPGCTTKQAFVEGGLLFQMSESRKEMHVTEESSGDHVITLAFFKGLSSTHKICGGLEGISGIRKGVNSGLTCNCQTICCSLHVQNVHFLVLTLKSGARSFVLYCAQVRSYRQ
ncbi:hypothetical protein Pelo_18169 [Pelomyxa schiedti]|nr:hypothetical protein Pelo_18169 [Pelomyxa schiedti]